MRSRSTRRGVFVALAVAAIAAAATAQEFLLQVPGQPELTSTAVVSGTRLVVTDSQGQRFIYTRQPQFDSPDGRYLGFYSQPTRQALRWPADGTGVMHIDDGRGGWRASRQRVQPLGANFGPGPQRPTQRPTTQRPNRIETRRPILDPGGFGQNWPGQMAGVAAQDNQVGRAALTEVAYLPADRDSLNVAYINDQGRLQMYRGWRDQWQHQNISFQDRLVPNAPLALAGGLDDGLPNAYTVDPQGQLIEINPRGRFRPIAQAGAFTPGSHFTVRQSGNGVVGFGVDAQGRLWQLDMANLQHQLIDANAGRFPPGIPLAFVDSAAAGQPPELFGIDRNGTLINYSGRDGRWGQPQVVGRGFAPGAPVAAFGGRPGSYAAAVDALGRLQVLSRRGPQWSATPIDGVTLPPGAPVALAATPRGLALSAIDGRGTWQHWRQAPGGAWGADRIATGFPVGGPVVFDPHSQTGFGLDATGRLVSAGYWNDDWHAHLLLPGHDFAPRLVRREVVPRRNLTPARVNFTNSGPEELVMQLVDAFDVRVPRQYKIPPRGSIPLDIPRDGGGTLQEVFAMPTPRGWVEEVRTFSLPPQPRFTVVAWANRVTYSYIDRKGVSVLPDFDLKTHVSLGVFDLPPGEFLQDGEQVDVFLEALHQGNPGAAAAFGPPAGGPEIVPREAPSPLLPPSVRQQFERRQPEPSIAPPTPRPSEPEDGPLLPPLPN